MRLAALAWLLAAAPYWEAKPPREWSPDELARMFSESPWAQATAAGRTSAVSVPVTVFLATAEPMKQAEAEARRRAKVEPDPDYTDFLAANEGKAIILAVRIDNPTALSDGEESRRMESESVLRAGRKKLRMMGHFPPSQADPHLRLAYPRQVSPEDKKLVFEIYVPGVPSPYRAAEFALKDLAYRGAPAF
ncbi:MAG TPA: hypothetical protein DEH78_24070 [Solibacterales bacterium]|nr:hypothetical protein [Bryobacterales bacterium]